MPKITKMSSTIDNIGYILITVLGIAKLISAFYFKKLAVSIFKKKKKKKLINLMPPVGNLASYLFLSF